VGQVDLVVVPDEDGPEHATRLPATLAAAMPYVFVESTLPLALIDADGRLAAVNASFASLVGRPSAGLFGTRLADLVHPDERLAHVASLAQLLGGRLRSDQLDARLLGPEGTVRPVTLYRNAVDDPETGRPFGLVAVHDATPPPGSDRTETLVAVARRLVEHVGDDRAVADVIVQALAEDVGDLAVVWLVDEDRDVLVATAGWHRDPARRDALDAMLSGQPRRRNEGIIARVIGLEHLLRLDPSDVELHRPALHPSTSAYIEEFGLSALVIAPLRAGGPVIGVIATARDRGGSGYNDEEVSLIARLAEITGPALVGPVAVTPPNDSEHAQAVLDAMSVGAAVLDVHGTVIEVNASWREAVTLGGPVCATVGQDFLLAAVRAEASGVVGAVELVSATRELLAGSRPQFAGDCGHNRADGAEAWFHLEVTPLSAGGAVVTQVDVTERKQLEIALAHEATHDALTGLPNRTLLADRIELALIRDRRAGLRTAVLYCDLDHFKEINDEHGHDYGDAVLRAVAERFTDAIRASDTVARMGGDEFVVLIEAVTSVDEALVVADKLVVSLIEPERDDPGHQTPLLPGVSVGVALSNVESTADSLMREADAAMYAAKQGGRSRVEIADDR
jgi:diguanylate cyclase (GGDEF)-like protein/PAS domain S-box-containing protein